MAVLTAAISGVDGCGSYIEMPERFRVMYRCGFGVCRRWAEIEVNSGEDGAWCLVASAAEGKRMAG
jgi:hypothetical protein